jgi:LmbE family N-acetylglucosaminyl deacetylase
MTATHIYITILLLLSIASSLASFGDSSSPFLQQQATNIAIKKQNANEKYPSCDFASAYSNILVVAAHPDDIETIAGGTVAYLVACGKNVNYLISTNGDKGWGKDYSMTSEELAGIRYQEQLDAAEFIGVKNVSMLMQEDCRLEGIDMIELKKNFTIAVRNFKPDLLLTFSPEIDYATYRFGLMHSDHQTTGNVAMNTLWPSARDYLSFYDLYEEGIMPWICPEVWLFQFSAPKSFNLQTVVVDIEGEAFDKKYEALLRHKSQYTDPVMVKESLKRIGNYVATSNNIWGESLSDKTLAEAFTKINIL